MITVRLYGLLRLDTGIREIQLEANNVKELYTALLSRCGSVTLRDLESCSILINGKQANKRSRLYPGDEVVLLSPVAGG